MNTIAWLGIASLLFVVAFTASAYGSTSPSPGQSRRQSIIEAWINIAIGFAINYTANLLVLPLIGAHISLADNWWMGWIYTTISIVRQYAIRRWFNDRLHRAARAIAGDSN